MVCGVVLLAANPAARRGGVMSALEHVVPVLVEEDPLERIAIVARITVAVAVVRGPAGVELERATAPVADLVREPQEQPLSARMDHQVALADPHGEQVGEQGARARGRRRGARRQDEGCESHRHCSPGSRPGLAVSPAAAQRVRFHARLILLPGSVSPLEFGSSSDARRRVRDGCR